MPSFFEFALRFVVLCCLPGHINGTRINMLASASLMIVFFPSHAIMVHLPVPKRIMPRCGLRRRSYQSVGIYRVPTPAQVVFPALEATKMSLFIVLPPCVCNLRFQSVAIYRVPASTPVRFLDCQRICLGSTPVSLTKRRVFPRLPNKSLGNEITEVAE